MRVLMFACLSVLACTFQLGTADKPNIVLLLADDYGWANMGAHHKSPEVHTPNIDEVSFSKYVTQSPCFNEYELSSLRQEFYWIGITLIGFVDPLGLNSIIYKYSRASLQSGRLAVHVNTVNTSPTAYNASDPVSGFAGIPNNMTGVAEKMLQGGYSTAMVGKWDAGMATPRQTPAGRGYEKWYGYFQHANNYWTKGVDFQSTGEYDVCLNSFTDLSVFNETYKGGVLDKHELDSSCQSSDDEDPECYEEHLFKVKGLEMIDEHDFSKKPLFYFHAFHLIHTPLDVPKSYVKKAEERLKPYEFDSENRKLYSAMVDYMDDVVGEITKKLKEKGVWDNTLIVFTSDNGGPIYVPGSANNHPLKGGKYSDWEGGIRTNAFISGGFVPKANRGSRYEGMISIADWYGMFAEFAGVDAHDSSAESANGWLKSKGLPTLYPVDSESKLWSKIINNKEARQTLHVSEKAVIKFPYKLVLGTQVYSGWTGQLYPNCTLNGQPGYPTPWFTDIKLFDRGINETNSEEMNKALWVQDCGSTGCLFNIEQDPTEHVDLLKESSDALTPPLTRAIVQDKHQELLDLLTELNKHVFKPYRGELSVEACLASIRNGGYYGPFVNADGFYTGPFPKKSAQDKLKDKILTEELKFLSQDSVQEPLVKVARKMFPFFSKQFVASLGKCEANRNYPELVLPISEMLQQSDSTTE